MNLIETPSKLGSNGTNLAENFVLNEKTTQSGKHGEVFFVNTPLGKNNFAVKRYLLSEGVNTFVGSTFVLPKIFQIKLTGNFEYLELVC